MKKPTLILIAALMAGTAAPSFAGERETGLLIGAGAGAAVGNAAAGRNGAVLGGLIGAVAGVAIADHHANERDDRRRTQHAPRQPAHGGSQHVGYRKPVKDAARHERHSHRHERDRGRDCDDRHRQDRRSRRS